MRRTCLTLVLAIVLRPFECKEFLIGKGWGGGGGGICPNLYMIPKVADYPLRSITIDRDLSVSPFTGSGLYRR